MKDFIINSAITMEPLKPYGFIHLSFFIIGVLLAVVVGIKIKKCSLKTLNKIIFGIGIFLLLSEIYKQLFYTIYIGNGNYQWWIFPFQLCSVPMYICLVMPFVKNKKIYNALGVFLMTYNLLGGFISFIEPSGLIHEYLFLTIHAFLWHMSLVFLGFIIGFNENIKKEGFKKTIILFLGFSLIAFIINCLFWNVSNGDINMFYVGPRISPIFIFKDIATKFGWYINTPIYLALLTLGAYIFFTIFKRK